MKVSFEDTEVRSFAPLPVGRYDSKVTNAQYMPESQRSGEPMIAWEYTVDGGEYDGRKVFHNTSLQPEAKWSTQRTLLALGMTKEEIDALEWDTDDPSTIQSTLDGLLEKECVVAVGHRMFEGEKRQQFRNIYPRA